MEKNTKKEPSSSEPYSQWTVALSEKSFPDSSTTLDDISGWFKNNEGGPALQELQRLFAQFCGAKYAFGVASGSAAIFTALKACGVSSRKDYVAVPSYTHIGSVAPIILAGGTPIFIEVNDYGNMNPADLACFQDLKAVIAVHQLGLPCEMDEIKEAARGAYIIEDASQSLGAEYKGKKAGVLGDIGCFSIGGGRTKTIGTGEGGMITTNNDKLALKCKNIRNHGDRNADAPYFCFNFRISDLNATIGLMQMDRLPFYIDWQIEKAEYLLKNLPDYLETLPIPNHMKPVRYLIKTRFSPEKAGMTRTQFLNRMKNFQIGPRQYIGGGYTTLISDVRFYRRYSSRTFHKSEDLRDNSIWIDWHRWPRTKKEIDKLLEALR